MQANSDVEKWVEDTLRLKGFDYGCKEENVFLLLRHLFCAVAMYDDMDAYNRAIVDVYVKKFKSVFNSKFSLKERKRNKQKKEKVSPNPLLKDKENNKEIEQKNLSLKNEKSDAELEQRRETFRQECLSYMGSYNDTFLADFFNYWSEDGKHSGKMRFECERFFNIKKRLERWAKNKFSSENASAAIRLEETKKRKTKESAPVEKQQVVAAQREAENLKREQEYEENKKKAVSYEQWLAMKNGEK